MSKDINLGFFPTVADAVAKCEELVINQASAA